MTDTMAQIVVTANDIQAIEGALKLLKASGVSNPFITSRLKIISKQIRDALAAASVKASQEK